MEMRAEYELAKLQTTMFQAEIWLALEDPELYDDPPADFIVHLISGRDYWALRRDLFALMMRVESV